MHEGERLTAYKCTTGHWTIGVGHRLLPGEPRVITKAQSDKLFSADLALAVRSSRRLVIRYDSQPMAAKIVVVSMVFQMGECGVAGFKNMLENINAARYNEAAHDMRDSRWYNQTRQRAEFLARLMETIK